MLKLNWIYCASLFFIAKRILCTPSTDLNKNKYAVAQEAAQHTALSFIILFEQCVESTMPNQQFEIDDLKSFVNHPSKTTVGYAPKFTSNRKYFANLISTTAFKEMLTKDYDELRKALIRKMKYCDEIVMDQELLKDFYNREVDQ